MPNTEVNKTIHVVAGIIRHPRNPSKLFFTQRQKGQHLEDLWEFPGGKLEKGESRFHALQRELEEETGIRVLSALPFHSLTHQYRDKNIFLDVWEVKDYSGRAHGREGQLSKWLDLEELSEYPFPEADLPVLQALMLPSELLITPELTSLIVDSSLQHFQKMMQMHIYPLVLFRSHYLDNKRYLDVATKLKEICDSTNAELIITRADLNSLQSKQFESFDRRHIDACSIKKLTNLSFDESSFLSVGCRDSKELELAEETNCNFILLSTSCESIEDPQKITRDWHRFKNVALQTRIPVFAEGNIDRKDLSVARYQGAIGVAGSTDFWSQ